MKLICRVYKITTRGYYKWRNKPKSDRTIREERLLPIIQEIHEQEPGFGYRFIHDELIRKGEKIGENQVYRICHKHGIFAHFYSKSKGIKKSPKPSHDDLVCRDFDADKPNKKWVTDVTEHPTKEGKIYFCAVKDLFSKKIVGWSFSNHNTAAFWIKALQNALYNRNYPKGVIVHSDRGSQPNSHEYRAFLRENGLRGSMGQAGTSADNAAMENWFSLLQKNVLNYKKWNKRQELQSAITYWTEVTYNKRRKQRKLGKLTPEEYDTIFTNDKLIIQANTVN